MTDETPTLRECKKQQTRNALNWAAVRLVVERGYDAVQEQDIAEAAGVSPRTFNNYFSSTAEAINARHLDRKAANRNDNTRTCGPLMKCIATGDIYVRREATYIQA